MVVLGSLAGAAGVASVQVGAVVASGVRAVASAYEGDGNTDRALQAATAVLGVRIDAVAVQVPALLGPGHQLFSGQAAPELRRDRVGHGPGHTLGQGVPELSGQQADHQADGRGAHLVMEIVDPRGIAAATVGPTTCGWPTAVTDPRFLSRVLDCLLL
jgi:hypothetical protein